VKNHSLSFIEHFFAYFGLFIALFAFSYFISPNVIVALTVGGLSVFLYMCIQQFASFRSNSTVSQVLFQLAISLLAIYAFCYGFYNLVSPILDRLNIYDWIIVIAFIIATAGTIIPIAKTKKRPLTIMYYLLLIGIIILTFIKSPENISFNRNKSLNAEDIVLLNKALDNYKSNNRDSYDTLKMKLNTINTRSDLDQFILFTSLILAGLTLVDWADGIKIRRKNWREKK
jgi:hypothetical protein